MLTQRQLTETIIQIRDEFLTRGEVSCVEEINHGLCADFATLVWERVGKPEPFIFSDDALGAEEYRHTFIVFRGRFYDAEAPEGVAEWEHLPVYGRQWMPWDQIVADNPEWFDRGGEVK